MASTSKSEWPTFDQELAFVVARAAAALRVEESLSVSEWASRYRILSRKASGEPGPWRNERTPYLTEIMDCLSSNSPVQEVYVMKGAQLGFTEAGNNWVGYVVDHAPGPMLMVQPTEVMAKRNSRQRLEPMIEDSPRLAGKIKLKRNTLERAANSTLIKEFPGGMLVMTGANSASGLRSMPARYGFLDEADAYPADVDGEGDPVNLALARMRTFARRKLFMPSTPTLSGASRIEQAYNLTDRRVFFVPCQNCGHMQPLVWEQIRYTPGDPQSARHECVACAYMMRNHEKTAMLALGEWRPTAQCPPEVRGYWISSLYSPVGWYSWAQMVSDHERAKLSREALVSFTNTVLGIPFQQSGEAPDAERLAARCEPYPIGQVPDGPLVLTAGVDVQKNRLEVEIVAWDRDKRSWSVRYDVYEGDTSQPEVYKRLDALLDEYFPTVHGLPLRISRLAIDSGYQTGVVYEWVKSRKDRRAMATKGSVQAAALLGDARPVEVGPDGRRQRHGLRVWMVNVDKAKEELYFWLNYDAPAEGEDEPSGYCHFPIGYPVEYFNQLTAERLMAYYVSGYRRMRWEKEKDRRNEALDCRILNRAAFAALKTENWADHRWAQIKEALTVRQLNEERPITVVKALPGQAMTPAPTFRPMGSENSWL
jgi:phage terminase large subunit GpA-like protein